VPPSLRDHRHRRRSVFPTTTVSTMMTDTTMQICMTTFEN
jgi:hypothetical protein